MANRLTIGYVKNGVLSPDVRREEMYNLDRKQIAAIAKRIFENANRRLVNLRARGLVSKDENGFVSSYSRAAMELLQNNLYFSFSARGKSLHSLINAIFDADNFLKQPDSTVKGARANQTELKYYTPNMTERERRLFIRMSETLYEMFPNYFKSLHNNKYESEQYKRYSVGTIRERRKDIEGGLGGDLFSNTKREIKATAVEREMAYLQALQKNIEKIRPIEERLKAQAKQAATNLEIRGAQESPTFSKAAYDKLNGNIDIDY